MLRSSGSWRVVILLARRGSGRLTGGNGNQSFEPPQGIGVGRLGMGVVLLWGLFPRRKARESMEVGMCNTIDVGSSLQDSVLMNRDWSVVPSMALHPSRARNQWSRHGVLVASRGAGRCGILRWVHNLRLRLETHRRLIRSRLLLGTSLHGLVNLIRPSTGTVPGRSSAIDLEASESAMQTHVPLR
jgi:hypothetical protein